MSCLGNIVWFMFAGLWQGIGWIFMGCLWCVTIIGIPLGKQCFKFAALSFCPFGKEIRYNGGTLSTFINVLWLLLSGWELALGSAINGLVLCATIVGIPWGLQCFKLAQLALMPLGAEIVQK